MATVEEHGCDGDHALLSDAGRGDPLRLNDLPWVGRTVRM